MQRDDSGRARGRCAQLAGRVVRATPIELLAQLGAVRGAHRHRVARDHAEVPRKRRNLGAGYRVVADGAKPGFRALPGPDRYVMLVTLDGSPPSPLADPSFALPE